ncbi:YdcF family protein [Martelella mediterranea]|uniref:Uncharacterized SAM-binding protein YcdF (DUF218 family) n=1 Tax=Martelella mediterranea TaxID=293089 RepID=A0A4R3NXM8_9HYPH|nr:YdcF family protein [Martelella mediterranea]TCT44500.1 uncharacterized SAM-binding protein YcdF (DUF218 family) [Martelella mediterranea]
MFLISKVFWIVFQPLAFACLSILLALLMLLSGKTGFGLFFIATALVILVVTLFTTTGTFLMAALENRFSRLESTTPPVCAIVLGGGIHTGHSAERGTYVFTRAADRYIETLRLARLYPDMHILITGGDNGLSGSLHGEAEPAARFFIDHGIDGHRLILESKARNTAENASKAARLLDENGIKGRCLLITSAYHMPRAIQLFEKQKVTVTPWPADYRTGGKAGLRFQFDRPATNATMLSTAMREWSGLIAYRLMGRTKTVLP